MFRGCYFNIEKYPQFELYKFTKKLNLNKEKMVPKNCGNRCVYSTIINSMIILSLFNSSFGCNNLAKLLIPFVQL